jgi:hypothetical protein
MSVKVWLAAAAAFVMGAGAAEAADLPSKKAAPVEYVRLCSVHGAGFFYIPGSDTCLRVGGRVRVEFEYVEPQWGAPGPGSGRLVSATGWRTLGRLNIDSRTSTEWGVLRAFFRYDVDYRSGTRGGGSAGVDQAYIQFAGFTAGRIQSFYDFYANDLNWVGNYGSDSQVATLVYTASFGSGFSATFGVEDQASRSGAGSIYNYNTKDVGDPGVVWSINTNRAPNAVGNLRYDGSWGSAQLSGAVGQAYFGPASQFGTSALVAPGVRAAYQYPSTDYGWAIQGGLKVKVPWFAAGDFMWLQAAYTDGLLSYIGVGSNQRLSGLSLLSPGFAVLSTPALGSPSLGVTSTKSTTGWNLTAGFLHYWTPTIRQGVFGTFTRVDPAQFYPGGYNRAYVPGLSDFDYWAAGTNVIWSPTSGFDIGLEAGYQSLNPSGRIYYVGSPATAFSVSRSELGAWYSRLRLQRDF